jgi:hypothetical protein
MRVGYVTALLSLPIITSADYQYNLNATIVGSQFFNAFRWETENDYTHGRVNYVDQNTAIMSNYSYGP